MTKLLLIDTASPVVALALGENGQVRTWSSPIAREHTKTLLLAIRELGWTATPFDAIAVIRGPGSYAGLRVGIATAEGLALAQGLPLIGVGTFEVLGRLAGLGEFLAVHPIGRGTFAYQRLVDGEPAGPLGSGKAEEFPPGADLVGEGAGALGGYEVSPVARCGAALTIATERLAAGSPSPATPIYAREPATTPPRSPGMLQTGR